ncbi:hypothetical protein L1D54_06440 [Vibrio brasiliensis]|uniref:hypothetical protein n=1 Tax=Vibrio brasiliensis TaxID=170652 RepID=UPI001EFC7D73|nr:hypothetical protein [Vibrio brasiliensis]MCG9750111.1 hypothetical protein [Vibrio brasiliensis]
MLLVSVSVLSGLYSILNTSEQKSIRVTGSKPIDATVKVWANYWVYGDDCEAYSYDMFGRKARQGGKITTFFTPNEVDSDDRYEFDVPYSSYTNSNNCTVELRDIKVEAYNLFDAIGFAQLRIYQSGTSYKDRQISLNSAIKAKNCDAFLHQWKDKTWSGGLGCHYYVNDEKKSKEQEFNAETVYFDFSQFNSDTVITYDILAGEEYRSTPLDPETGK